MAKVHSHNDIEGTALMLLELSQELTDLSDIYRQNGIRTASVRLLILANQASQTAQAISETGQLTP